MNNDNDAWGGKPVSEIYKIAYDNMKHRIEERGERFRQDKAIKCLAEMHADKVKELIDEDMGRYDKAKLTAIVERCVAKYIKLDEE